MHGVGRLSYLDGEMVSIPSEIVAEGIGQKVVGELVNQSSGFIPFPSGLRQRLPGIAASKADIRGFQHFR
jgi:hypothetical protein